MDPGEAPFTALFSWQVCAQVDEVQSIMMLQPLMDRHPLMYAFSFLHCLSYLRFALDERCGGRQSSLWGTCRITAILHTSTEVCTHVW